MKAHLLNIEGKKIKDIELPEVFSSEIREDIVSKVLEVKKTMQPYAPSLVAGKQHAASGKIVHRRHVWRSGYGRGMSRVPRKIFSRKGSQFNWAAAEVASTRGGRRAHPPKTISMINKKKVNKKEMNIAMKSAVSATADKKIISRKYSNLDEQDVKGIPFVVESRFFSLKTKELLSGLKKILGEKLFDKALRKKKGRSGKGKLRGRKYERSAGILIVTGNKSKVKSSAFDMKSAENLSISDLARGGLGRLTIYTEDAIKTLGEKLR